MDSNAYNYRVALYSELQPSRLLAVAVIGLCVGFLVWAFTALLQNFVFETFFCNSTDNFLICANGGKIANNIAIVFATLLGLFALVGRGVARPMLIGAASALTLWGIGPALGGLGYGESLLWMMGAASLAYITYWWLFRIHNTTIAVSLILLTVIISRVLILI